MKIFPSDVYAKSDVNATFQGKLHIFQNAFVTAATAFVDTTAVIYLAYAVQRQLNVFYPKFFAKVKKGI